MQNYRDTRAAGSSRTRRSENHDEELLVRLQHMETEVRFLKDENRMLHSHLSRYQKDRVDQQPGRVFSQPSRYPQTQTMIPNNRTGEFPNQTYIIQRGQF